MKRVLILMVVFCYLSCVEPFEFEGRSSENVLVVEATLTDEFVVQTVILTRTSVIEKTNEEEGRGYSPNTPFIPKEDKIANVEKNATVMMLDDLGVEFSFSELEDGMYVSNVPFGAQEGRTYQLKIITDENEIFESDFMGIIGKSKINDLKAERIFNDKGDEGMAIYVDGADITNTSNFFRYTYEETYKIIAPNWTPLEFNILSEGDFTKDPVEYPAVELVARAQEEQICYKTINSSAVNLASTANLGESVITQNLVRFIDRSNPILSHRYSILVKQYLQSIDSFSYYESLRNFAKNESVFSEVQPGFLEGNIKAQNKENTVIGFFDVASVDQKRLFFNYADFFPNADLPPYFFNFNCSRRLSPPIGDPELDGPSALNCPQALVPRLKLELVEYVSVNDGPQTCEGPYFVTPRICGDCTILGSNVKPDFWVD